jgi:hypothetical protein
MSRTRFSKHQKNKRAVAFHFMALSALSIAAVFTIAVLSRAELRLSGEILAAGDGKDLAILSKLQAFDSVEMIREEDDLRLYILGGDLHDYLVEVTLQEGEWEVSSVEKMHD